MSSSGHVDLEAEYDNRARVPEHQTIIDGWEKDAAAYRSARAGHCELGVAYGGHPRQRIDLFEPDRPEASSPLLVFIHGGYWRSLDPSLFSHMAAGANGRGISVAVPGYRLCPEVGVLDIISDVRTACLFLHRRWPGRKLIACGHSAGGHLAAAMAATDWQAADPHAPGNLLRKAMAISGLFDLTPLLATSVNDSLLLDAAEAEAASPAFWAVPTGVSLQAWVGGEESPEYLRQSRLVADRWARSGAQTRFKASSGDNHFTAPAPLAEPASAMTSALVALCATTPGEG